MSYRIAVASSDGKVVNQHFGHTRQFLVFEVEADGKWSFKEMRNTEPACGVNEHSTSSMSQAVGLLSDCRAVIVSQIGFGARQALGEKGIQAYEMPVLIHSALKEVAALQPQ